MVNLAHQGDIREEHHGTSQLQRLAGLAIVPLRFPQPPATAMRAEHQQQSGGNLYSAGNGIPMSGNQQHNSRRNQSRPDEGNDGEKFDPVVFEVKMNNDPVALIRRDQSRLTDFVNILGLHILRYTPFRRRGVIENTAADIVWLNAGRNISGNNALVSGN